MAKAVADQQIVSAIDVHRNLMTASPTFIELFDSFNGLGQAEHFMQYLFHRLDDVCSRSDLGERTFVIDAMRLVTPM